MLLFPLVTFPYVSRIMLADGIGQVNFYTSIINYVLLFTSLGIPLYGVREIAKVKDDATLLNKTLLEILSLNLLFTIIGYIAVFLLSLLVPEIKENIPMFLILSLNLIFTAIGVEWFYKGIEDFKYITIRSVLMRVLCLVLLFLLVKKRDDILIYSFLTILGTVGGNIFNFIRLRKFVSLSKVRLRNLIPHKHLKPILTIFMLTIITSIYCNLDTVLLGFLAGNSAVGYYTGATKISHALLALITSTCTILIPRLSSLVKSGDTEEFQRISQKAMDLIVFVSIPLTLGLVAVSTPLIHLFCGDSYEPAISTLCLISPTLVIIAISNIFGVQILYPLGKEKIVIACTSIGAILNLVLNIILIPLYAEDGAAIATVIAELGVTLSMAIIGRIYIPVKYYSRHYLNCFLAALIMFISCIYIQRYIHGDTIQLLFIPLSGGLIYIVGLVILKDSFFIELLKQLVRSICRK